MKQRHNQDDETLRRFLHSVWQHDVRPLLRGRKADQRRKSARIGGRIAATGGLVLDSLLHLRGRPFTRAMTVLGSSLGAMLPDAWDWKWLRQADARQRKVVDEQIRRRAARLPEADALALFALPATASREDLKHKWRTISQRWHPDKAPDDDSRAEYHVRFVAYQSAYERLSVAYDEGRLPAGPPAHGASSPR